MTGLFKDNIARVRSIAGQYVSKTPVNVTLHDLIGIGWLAVLDATSKYKQNTPGYKSIISRAIKNDIIDFLRKLDNMPRGRRKEKNQIDEATRRCEQFALGKPNLEEVAKEAGITVDQYHYINALSEFGAVTAAEFDESSHGNVEVLRRKVDDRFTSSELLAAIERLHPPRKMVIKLRYYDDIDCKEIARRAGLDPARITQLHIQAIDDLRDILDVRVAVKRVNKRLTLRKDEG